MANGVNPIAGLRGRVTASGALVITIAASTGQPAGTVGSGINPILSCQGRVTANNELVVRFG